MIIRTNSDKEAAKILDAKGFKISTLDDLS